MLLKNVILKVDRHDTLIYMRYMLFCKKKEINDYNILNFVHDVINKKNLLLSCLFDDKK